MDDTDKKLTDLDKALLRLLQADDVNMMHTFEMAEVLGVSEDDVCKSMRRLEDAGFAEFHPDTETN